MCLASNTGFAKVNNENLFGNISVVSESTENIKLKDGLIKKEIISMRKYTYSEDLSKSNDKYITFQITVMYYDESNNDVLAVVDLETNFRYNSLTKEAVCLSVARGDILNVRESGLTLVFRPADVTTEVGGSVAKLKFKYNEKVYDDVTYKITCDYLGNISCD